MLGGHGFVKFAFGQFRIVDAFRSRLQLLLFAGFVCQQASFRDYRVNLRHEGHSRRRYAYEARKGSSGHLTILHVILLV